MQFSVYDIVTKLNLMQDIIDQIESGDQSLNDYVDNIHDLLQEYSDILKCAKVKI